MTTLSKDWFAGTWNVLSRYRAATLELLLGKFDTHNGRK
jgi:hypothetical protein